MKDHDRPDGRSMDSPLGEAKPSKDERVHFVFGKDQTLRQMANTINTVLGLPLDTSPPNEGSDKTIADLAREDKNKTDGL